MLLNLWCDPDVSSLYLQAHLRTQTFGARRSPAPRPVTPPQCFAAATPSPTSTHPWTSTSIQASIPTTTQSFLPPQVQPRAPRSPATRSPLLSRPARAHGVTNAPFATRMWWTPSSTPVDTCVSATPVASNSRRWLTRAAPSAGGQSKISSRPTGARRLVFRQCVSSSGSAQDVVKAM